MESSTGKLSAQMKWPVVKIMGFLMIACGILAFVGSILETAGWGTISGDTTGIERSVVKYAGFWCGILIIAAGAVTTHSAKLTNDFMVIVDVVAAVFGIVFGIVVLALPAQKMQTTEFVGIQEACKQYIASDTSGFCSRNLPLVLAGFSLMIAGGALAMIFGCVLGAFSGMAVFKGLIAGGEVKDSSSGYK